METPQELEGSERTFADLMKLWVTPEIKRRQDAGLLPKPVPLRAAQVILYPDERPVTVRLNEEVRAVAKMRVPEGVTKQPGDPVFEHELTKLEEIKLTDDDDPNCAHVTMLLLNGHWVIAFDFRRNKLVSREHQLLARDFHKAAAWAAENKIWSVFVDTLFSSAELAAKAWLLLLADAKFARKPTHDAIRMKYQTFGQLNVEPGFIDTLNKLSGWRNGYRYLRQTLTVDENELAAMLPIVARMIQDADARSAD